MKDTPNLVGSLLSFDACALSDALDSLGLTGTVTGLTACLPGRRIAGRVRTIRLKAGSPPPGAPVRHLGALSIDSAAAGEVIVVEQRTGVEAGCWGGLLSRAALHKGIAGVIADGPLRDVDEAREIEFPIFCRSFTAFTARGRVHEDTVDEPVTIGNVLVSAGDYVLADSSACVFVAADRIEEAIEAAKRIGRKEAEMIRRLKAGGRVSEVLGASYEHMLRPEQ